MGPHVETTESAAPALLVLSTESILVRITLCSVDTPSDGMTAHLTRATWGARCGKSARRVLRGGRGTSDLGARLAPHHHSLSQDLLLRAVKKHAPEQRIVLYIERWLKAPVQEEDGRLVPREKGTPQGGVVSPLLANLFLHYALDRWLAANYPQVPFERYADDGVPRAQRQQNLLLECATVQLMRVGPSEPAYR